MNKEQSKSKYRNKKVEHDGMIFDSKRELKRYLELLQLEKAGFISRLARQTKYELIPKCGKNRACHYIADFEYVNDAGELIIEDAKGMKTREYIIKKKIMLWRWNIEVKEI